MSEPLPTTPSFRLDGRRALITGAGRGIGRAGAVALAAAGAEVVLAARTGAEIDALADEIRDAGGIASAMQLDVGNITAARAAIEDAGPFHILVNNAGTNRPAPFLDVTEEDYDAVVDLNLKAAFFVAQAVVRGMVAAGIAGSVIHVGSQMGHVGGPTRTVYCTTKHGIEGLTKAMAADLAPLGIRVNTLAPTFVETPMTKPFLANEQFRQSVLSNILLGRTGKVEDLMGAIVFLASDASALMTGGSLLVDGGWTAV